MTDVSDSAPASARQAYVVTEGFLTRQEVVDLLHILLHAERAGARVCSLSLRSAPTEAYRRLLQSIQRDEARSCRRLIECLRTLGTEPDDQVGDFVDKCLAIEDFPARMAFLNRGQGWVVKKITQALPRIRQRDVQRQLSDMLEEHQRNIAMVNAFLAETP